MSGERRRAERRAEPAPVGVERRSKERRTGERRREARAPLDLWVEEENGDELYFRRTGNVSLGGLSFDQTIPHVPGTRLKLRFTLPGVADIIEVEGEVVSAHGNGASGPGMGLRFLSFGEPARSVLSRFLEGAP